MIPIVQQTIDFYLRNFKTPKIDDLEIRNQSLLVEKWAVFITIYKNWEIRWSAWNIKEIKDNLVEELIENTISAIYDDSRFEQVKYGEIKDLKIRVDLFKTKTILQDKEILTIDPTKFWVLAIKKDYSSMAVVLPNINPILLTWDDIIPVLEWKFGIKNFNESDFILYKIETEVHNNFDIKKLYEDINKNDDDDDDDDDK